jgi:4-hydroxy-tetrahydrodipicolinate synthase
MLTPFNSDGSVDYEGLKALTEWYLRSGATGLFTVAQSSEMFSLSPEERIACAKCVVEAAAGRVPVVASGTFPPLGAGGSGIEAQAESVRAMAATGVAAVVVLAGCMAEASESEEVFKANVAKLLELTPGVPLGQYECPQPNHRRCTPETLAWLARTGRFSFHKDTSRFCPLISEKLRAIQSADLPPDNPFRFYNGNVTTLSHSLAEGGAGAGVVCANFYPELVAWLVANFHAADGALVRKVQRFLTLADALVKVNYPASAKVYVATHCGVKIGPKAREGSAWPEDGAAAEEGALRLAALKSTVDELKAEIGM